jgi:hypothetical protein
MTGSRFAVALLLLVTIAGVARTEPRLASVAHAVKERDDVWLLPPPSKLKAATLGYSAAGADLLWAKLLVEYGIHMSEHNPFPDLNVYVDAILALEPGYGPLYDYIDTILVYRPVHGTEEDARAARRYLELGLEQRPRDHKLWLRYGQFIAFLAPSFLKSDADKDQWRRQGAEAIIRAVELGADADRSLAAASMLRKWGKTDAALRYLRQSYALTDDENTRAEIAAQLRAIDASEEQDAAERTVRAIESRWRRDMPFVPRGEFLLLGPELDPMGCAGLERAGKPSCAHDWDEALTDEP